MLTLATRYGLYKIAIQSLAIAFRDVFYIFKAVCIIPSSGGRYTLLKNFVKWALYHVVCLSCLVEVLVISELYHFVTVSSRNVSFLSSLAEVRYFCSIKSLLADNVKISINN